MGKLLNEIIEEFESKKEYKRRTAEGIADAIGEDTNVVKYVLENSDCFEKQTGKNGKEYYVLVKKPEIEEYEIVNVKIKKKKGLSLSSAIQYISEQGFEVVETTTETDASDSE